MTGNPINLNKVLASSVIYLEIVVVFYLNFIASSIFPSSKALIASSFASAFIFFLLAN